MAHYLANAPQLSERDGSELQEIELVSLTHNSRKADESDLRMYTKWLNTHYPKVIEPALSTSMHMVLWLKEMSNRGLVLATIQRRVAIIRRLILSLRDADVLEHYKPVLIGLQRSMDTERKSMRSPSCTTS